VADAVIPDGWLQYTSPYDGSVAFAYKPEWMDLSGSPEDEQFREDALGAVTGGEPDDAVVLLGHWRRAASATLPISEIQVVKVPHACADGDLPTVVEQYARARAALYGDDSPKLLSHSDYPQPLGYAGWKVMLWANFETDATAIDVTGIAYGDTVVFVVIASPVNWVTLDAVATSIVFLPGD